MPRQPPPASALPTDVSEYDTMQGPSTTSPFINAGKMMMAGPQTAPHLPVPPKGAWDEQDSGSSNSSEFISNGNPMYHSIAIQTSPSMLEAATSTGSDAGGLRSVVTAPAMVNWQEAAEETASCWNQFDDGLLGNANNLGDLLCSTELEHQPPAATAPALAYPESNGVNPFGLVNPMNPMITLPVLAQCYVTMPLMGGHPQFMMPPVVTVGNPPIPPTNPAMGGTQPETVSVPKEGTPNDAACTSSSEDDDDDDDDDDGEDGDGKKRRRRRRRRRHRGRGRRGRGKTKKAAAAAAAGEHPAEGGEHTDHDGMPLMCSSSEGAESCAEEEDAKDDPKEDVPPAAVEAAEGAPAAASQ